MDAQRRAKFFFLRKHNFKVLTSLVEYLWGFRLCAGVSVFVRDGFLPRNELMLIKVA